MNRDVSRRAFLGSAAAVSLSAVAGRAAGRSKRAFDPFRHGFDFPNWAPDDGRFPDHDHEKVSPDEVERVIRERWDDPFANSMGVQIGSLPDSLLTAIARQLYVSAVQASASNGHCWGMAFTAQHYFENPDAIPAGKRSASEFRHPMVPLSNERNHPVSDDIDDFQLFQVLDADAWIGRRAILNPGWIALDRQLRNLSAAIDEFGTATMTLIDPKSRASHLVLAYDVRTNGTRTEIDVYDPNVPARSYKNDLRRTVVVKQKGNGVKMEPYDDYSTFLYNDRERVIAARGQAEPAPAFSLKQAELREELLSVAVFLLDSPDAQMTVVDPSGNPVRRDWAPFATREASRYHQMRYRYNPKPGRYSAVVTGRAATDASLSILAADRKGELVRAERTAYLEPGDSIQFAVDVPETGAETGSVERTNSLPDWAIAAGGAAVGALGTAGAMKARDRFR